MEERQPHQRIQSKVQPIEIKGGAVPPKLPASPTMQRMPYTPVKPNKDQKK